jgi:hypothetical protein
MLQLLHLDVLKIDQVLYTRCAREAAGGVDDVRGGVDPLQVCSLASLTRYASFAPSARERPNAIDPDGRPNTSKSK